MSRDNPAATTAEDHTQHCLQILADVNLSVQAHDASLYAHGEDLLFSPREISFITQQREQFIEYPAPPPSRSAPAPCSPSPPSTRPVKRKRQSSICSTTTNYNGKNGPQQAWPCTRPWSTVSVPSILPPSKHSAASHAGILSLSYRELLGNIIVMFGSLHAGDVFYIENHIKEELTSFAAFRDFISRNSLNYDILAKIPHPISDITKIHWLENSLQRCPQFDIPIGTWKSLNTSVASRSCTSLVQYLSDQYSSLPADTSSRGGKAFGATDDSRNNTLGRGEKR